MLGSKHMRRFCWTLLVAGLAASVVGCAEPSGPVTLVHGQVLTVQLSSLDDTRAVDILFVIDDSSSMAQAQANLAANFHRFIEVLEDPFVDVDYRVALTTTDSGNPRCPGSSSERGALVARPCTQRLDDFVLGDLDLRALACTDVCTLSDAELEIVPTTTERDELAKPRPWLEHIAGTTNLPAGVELADAFACMAPQGIAGCDFEAPLESMVLALDRFEDAKDPAYGFLRADAITMIVFITDGHECSYAEDWADIFSPTGNRAFWSDPSADAPTSAVCWNAGVECVGDPSGYEACVAVDRDVEGQVGVDEANAVLHPVARYVDRVQALEDNLRSIALEHEIIVSLIGGVRGGGENASLFYADAEDPEFQGAHGIGPGCTSPMSPASPKISALPPVRLLEFAEAFTPDNAFSICDSDYLPALESIVRKNPDQIQPACFPGCVRDIDPASVLVEPECYVEAHRPGGARERIEPCLRDDSGYVVDPSTMDFALPNADAKVCHARSTDSSGVTADPNDDMSPFCADGNFNLEFKIARRPGYPAARGTAIYATCSISDHPSHDCPGIGE